MGVLKLMPTYRGTAEIISFLKQAKLKPEVKDTHSIILSFLKTKSSLM